MLMKTVHEVSNISGVSVRTLHHYDAIGLLKPTKLTDAGYRLYDDAALAKLQTILLFRELQFPLKEIKAIIDSPNFDKHSALEQQVELLELQRKHIDELISYAREIIKTGVNHMSFSVFNKQEIEEFTAKAKEKWGDTAAFNEFEEKNAGKSSEQITDMANGLMSIFAEIGKIKTSSPDSDEAQAAVEKLRRFICDNYYNCTVEILSGLGQMYAADGEFTDNIDKAGGKGTAAFASKAIEVYCNKNRI